MLRHIRARVGCYGAATALAGLAWAAHAGAPERIGVTDLKPLLATALDHGEGRGVLVGEPAQWIRQHFRTSAPIEIDVTLVERLARPGCARLAITTAQGGVWDYNREQRARSPERKAFTWSVNYCRDGSLPVTEATE